MSFRPKDLHAQISTLTSELELSTFLNKGVLQTNSEYKIRIVELERENAVLRIAESRLARTEDRLEAAEKRLREMDKAEREWEEEMQKELGLREVVERESDVWREKYERLKEGWDGTRSFMERVEGQVTMVRPDKVVSATKRRTDKAGSPFSSPVGPKIVKKRRRVQETPPILEPPILEPPIPAPESPRISPHHRRGLSPVRPPVTQPTSKPRLPRPATSAKKHGAGRTSDPVVIKVEDDSPPGRWSLGVDSDEDPLAML